MFPNRRFITTIAASALAFGLVACGGDSETTTTTQPPAGQAGDSTVKVELGEDGAKFFVKVDRESVPAGKVTFVIDNVGTMHHELAIFKTDLPADKLPLTDEGKVDEEKAGQLAEADYP